MGFPEIEKALIIKQSEDSGTLQLTSQAPTRTQIMFDYDPDNQLFDWLTATDEMLDLFNNRTNSAVAIIKIIEPTQIEETLAFKQTFCPVGNPMIMVTNGDIAGAFKCDTNPDANVIIHAAAQRVKYCVPQSVATNRNNNVLNDIEVRHIEFEGTSLRALLREDVKKAIGENKVLEFFMIDAQAEEIDDWRAKGDPNASRWSEYRFTEIALEELDNAWQVAYDGNESTALTARFGVPKNDLLDINQALAITLNNSFMDIANQLIGTQIISRKSFKRIKQQELTSEQITPASLSSQTTTLSVASTPPETGTTVATVVPITTTTGPGY